MPLSDKFSPKSLAGIVGNRSAVEALLAFSAEVQEGNTPRPIILHGPTGTGKTSAARAVAYSNGFEIIELSASDYRDEESLRKKLLPAGSNMSLFKTRMLIILDEIDELSPKFDSGAEKIIAKLVKTSRQPIIMTANNYWARSIAFLRAITKPVEFKRPGVSEVSSALARIVGEEHLDVSADVVEAIARRNNGDIRGAINDLEACDGMGDEMLQWLGVRERKVEIFGLLDKIFLSENFDAARLALANSDVDMDMVMNWIDENIPNRFSSRDGLRDGYAQLSCASRFSNLASRTSYYGYLRYASVVMSSGVAVSSHGRISMLKPYAFPSTVRSLSASKRDRGDILGITNTLSKKLHTDRKKIANDYLPLLRRLIAAEAKGGMEKEAFEFYESKYGLDKKDLEFIMEYYKYYDMK